MKLSCCCAIGCTNRHSKGFLMKGFPKNPLRRKVWIEKIERENWTPTRLSYLCEVHFSPEMWEKSTVDGKKTLKRTAIPTIFPHVPPGKVLRPPSKPQPSVIIVEPDTFKALTRAEKQKRYREREKANPVEKEEFLRKERERVGRYKNKEADMSAKQHNNAKLCWRMYKKKQYDAEKTIAQYDEARFQIETSQQSAELQCNMIDSRTYSGRKKVLKNRSNIVNAVPNERSSFVESKEATVSVSVPIEFTAGGVNEINNIMIKQEEENGINSMYQIPSVTIKEEPIVSSFDSYVHVDMKNEEDYDEACGVNEINNIMIKQEEENGVKECCVWISEQPQCPLKNGVKECYLCISEEPQCQLQLDPLNNGTVGRPRLELTNEERKLRIREQNKICQRNKRKRDKEKKKITINQKNWNQD